MKSTVVKFNMHPDSLDSDLFLSVLDTATGREYDFGTLTFVPAGTASSPFTIMTRLTGRYRNGREARLVLPDPAKDSDYITTFHNEDGTPVTDADYLAPDGTAPIAATPGAPAPAAAMCLGQNTVTQGSWLGVYGGEGYTIVGGESRLPAGVTITTTGGFRHAWALETSDVRALQTKGDGSNRMATCLYSNDAVTLDLDLGTTRSRQVSLYFLDWDSPSRLQRIDVLDAATDVVLDSRIVADFHDGVYLSWILSGHVKICLTNLSSINAVLSGIFFGDARPAS